MLRRPGEWMRYSDTGVLIRGWGGYKAAGEERLTRGHAPWRLKRQERPDGTEGEGKH